MASSRLTTDQVLELLEDSSDDEIALGDVEIDGNQEVIDNPAEIAPVPRGFEPAEIDSVLNHDPDLVDVSKYNRNHKNTAQIFVWRYINLQTVNIFFAGVTKLLKMVW